MGAHRLAAHGRSDTGLRRSSNEDAFGIFRQSDCFVVADGVGGAAAGEVAGHMFVAEAGRLGGRDKILSQNAAVTLIKDIFLTANQGIWDHGLSNPECAGMSCTAEVLIVHDEGFVVGHVGDSRSYRYRGGRLTRLTTDHSLVQEQLDKGLITPENMKEHRYRNVILRAVGSEETIDVDIIRGGVRSGDIFLLCTDGLTDMVSEEELALVLGRQSAPEEKTERMVELANRAGGRDNITAVVVEVLP